MENIFGSEEDDGDGGALEDGVTGDGDVGDGEGDGD